MKLYTYAQGKKCYFDVKPEEKIETRTDIVKLWGRRFSKKMIPHVFTPDDVYAEPEFCNYWAAMIVYAPLGAYVGNGLDDMKMFGWVIGLFIGTIAGWFGAYRHNRREIKKANEFNQSITPRL